MSGSHSTVWPSAASASPVARPTPRSTSRRPGKYGCGSKLPGNECETKRGASTASCALMPNTVWLRNTWSIACACRSPPGAPNGMNQLVPRRASAGFGVRRGRLPGATHDAWPGTAHDCEPRVDGTKPSPGITGASHDESLGVADITLPRSSTTQTYDVSPGSGLASVIAGVGI